MKTVNGTTIVDEDAECPDCEHVHGSQWEYEHNAELKWCDVPTCGDPGCCNCPCFYERERVLAS